MREHRRRDEKGCTHHGMLIPLFLPTPTHRESHGDILNSYSHPTNGMKISPTEVLWRKLGGEKKKRKKGKGTWSTNVCQGRAAEKASSNGMGQECYWGGEPLILSYCLNILYIPILRFNIKIEISTEFCPWKHNSEKAHVQINPRRRGTLCPSLHEKHPQPCFSIG